MLQNGIEIFNTIGFAYKESDNQKDKGAFTTEHVRYDCIITNGKSIKVPYYCNPRYSKPNKRDVLSCLCLGYKSYEMNKDSIGGFLCELGYNSSAEAIDRGIKVFAALKKQCQKMDKMFSREEFDDLLECITALENGDIRLNDDREAVDMDGIEENMDM